MLKFLLWMFRFTGAVLWFVVSFIAFLAEDLSPHEHFADWDGDDGIDSRSGATVSRTSVGRVEPLITSARGESVGLMSGVKIKS